jgi:hypothetical protein
MNNDSNTSSDSTSFGRNVRASVFASIIVLVLIQPIMSIAWTLLLSGADSTFRFVSESVYQNAALGSRNWVCALLVMGALTIMAGVLIGGMIVDIIPTRLQIIIRRALPARKTRKAAAARVTLKALGLIAVVFCYTLVYADIQLNTSFEQRLTVLTPHVDAQEIAKCGSQPRSSKGFRRRFSRRVPPPV